MLNLLKQFFTELTYTFLKELPFFSSSRIPSEVRLPTSKTYKVKKYGNQKGSQNKQNHQT